MILRTIFEVETGRIIKTLMAPDGYEVPLGPGESCIEGNFPDDKYYIVDGTAVEKELIEVPGQEPVPEPITAGEIRALRNELLKSTDWTQLEDSPVDKTVWATYRQALRDVPEQEDFPESVVWPAIPNEVIASSA
jgi:hypothetical protein